MTMSFDPDRGPSACMARVSIAQKRPEVLKRIKTHLGFGSLVVRRNITLTYLRFASRENISDFIKRVDKYVIVKKPHVELMKQFLSLPRYSRDPKVKERKKSLFLEFKALNGGRMRSRSRIRCLKGSL